MVRGEDMGIRNYVNKDNGRKTMKKGGPEEISEEQNKADTQALRKLLGNMSRQSASAETVKEGKDRLLAESVKFRKRRDKLV